MPTSGGTLCPPREVLRNMMSTTAINRYRRFKPESVYIEPFAENRYLEIARGNDETEFGRRACLDLNTEIIEIATSAKGLALYWKAAGPQVLARSDA